MSALAELTRRYRDRESAAREWKARGGQVVGFVSADVPEELILAAGFFPLRVAGEPRHSTAIADRYLPASAQAPIRSLMNRILDGSLSFLDHLVLSNSSEGLLRLFYFLREIRRLEPNPRMPNICFYEFLHTRFRTSALYNRERVRGFKRQLEAWSGKSVSDESLRQAISDCNENRRLLQEIADRRIESPPRVDSTTALQIIGSSMFMSKPEHNRLLRQLLTEMDQPPPEPRARIFVEGDSLDNLHLYEIIESSGATVIAEDSDWGNRYFDTLVEETADPIDALTDRYQFRAPSPTKVTVQERVQYLTRQVAATRPDGVLFYILQGENPAMWDYPEQRNAMEAMGIPTLCLDHQSYAIDAADELKSRIMSFIRSLKTREPA